MCEESTRDRGEGEEHSKELDRDSARCSNRLGITIIPSN